MNFFKADGTVDARLLHLAEWVVGAGLKTIAPELLLQGFMERLNAASIPVARIQVAFRVLHPLFSAMAITVDEAGPNVDYADGSATASERIARTPYTTLVDEGLDSLRLKLDDVAAIAPYPILKNLEGRGFADYLAMRVSFLNEVDPDVISQGILVSLSSREPETFDSDTIAALSWLAQPLALAMKVEINGQIAGNALRTFHGEAAGKRILGGTIRRGAGERLRTVIWYSDLRNSTGLADRLPLDAFLELLNCFFECSAGAVLAAGGQVLELIGDAVLAIFPVDGANGDALACAAAVTAARDAHARLLAFRRSTPDVAEPIAFGTGLHIGNLIFGNVGTADRLNFGLVGSAVSETARLEALTKTLGRAVLLSEQMAAVLDEPLEDLGCHALRGVETPRRIWALPLPPS